MKIAKIEIANDRLLKKIKKSINRLHFVECGLCGAFRVDAIELARVIHSFGNRSEEDDDELNDYSDILASIIECEPEFESCEEYEKWKSSNDRPAYHFLDDDGYISQMYGSYDEIIIFYDLNCDCFSKDKIAKLIL